uniref:Uncharacterized protein n=1 Tax=Chromera velia CCMP2878 TaxID=1169474 RepID=A0A0G4FPQ9_9ALVE|eukprot:Cvel_3604.t1-p1 / transcript=Cvel_3604.t1 / gene=Cvel_3604 / organism=Chromera_velia_CCMP2878 / gene_product=hypothetical protein / transcript_product=hypothetical protein / location=Cvel_scaffold148:16763-17440(+) / protein_length=226 / sequence_SO=supercontig / SO=protein_coding / is_pseudo=false
MNPSTSSNLKFISDELPQRQQVNSSEDYLELLQLWAKEYASYAGLRKLKGAIEVSSFLVDKALQRQTVSLASNPQHVLLVRQAGEELANFKDRVCDWTEKFLQTLSGDNTQLSPDLQKETAWATFKSFVTFITEIIVLLVGVALSLSFKEKYFAYKGLLADLKSRSLEPADFVVRVKFWSLLPEEIKALARTKPKKQVRGTGDPLSVKHSWKYMQEVIEEAMATLN